MDKLLKSRSRLIDRVTILDGLRAVYLTQTNFGYLLKEDSYACGYQEGFESALASMAQMIGCLNEFNSIRRHHIQLCNDDF